MIYCVSVACCQEAGKMRTENCFLDLATTRDFGKSDDQSEEIETRCRIVLFSKFALKRGDSDG